MDVNFSVVSIFPPLLVMVIGYLTHRVVLSLVSGIILAALLAEHFALRTAGEAIAITLWQNFIDTSNLHIFIFLIFLGIIIVMLQFSGGAYAYTQYVKQKVKGKRGVETASLLLSTGLFLDDYLGALTVGSVMHPLTDAQKIPKVKIAFLVDSMACPFAILCPFSGWVAAVLGFLGENGISPMMTEKTLVLATPFTAYLAMLPFLFYSFILIATVWYIVQYKISFGLMKKHEIIAAETGDLYGGNKHHGCNIKAVEHNPHHTTLLEFFLPIAIMLLSFILGVTLSGNAATGLMLGGLITVVICLAFFIMRGRILIPEIPKVLSEGVKLMYSCIIVLLLAWTLGDFLRNQLHTGQYLAGLMLHSGISVTALPMIVFFAGCVITTTTGSAWGSAAMLFPIVIPLVLSMTNAPPLASIIDVPMLFVVLGAALSGCIAGNHVSPIGDTTIMSCLSTRANLKDHVYTQLQYALPGILITGLCFWMSGYLIEYGLIFATLIPIFTAIFVTCAILRILQLNDRKVST